MPEEKVEELESLVEIFNRLIKIGETQEHTIRVILANIEMRLRKLEKEAKVNK